MAESLLDGVGCDATEPGTCANAGSLSSRPVGVTMRTDLLEDFRVERASDPDVVRALVTDRLGERFVRERKTVVSGRWACSEKDRQDAERIAEILNARAGAR